MIKGYIPQKDRKKIKKAKENGTYTDEMDKANCNKIKKTIYISKKIFSL